MYVSSGDSNNLQACTWLIRAFAACKSNKYQNLMKFPIPLKSANKCLICMFKFLALVNLAQTWTDVRFGSKIPYNLPAT